MPGYDYSRPGYYYITISSYQKQLLFGAAITIEDILDIPFQLFEENANGKLVRDLWFGLAQRYNHIELDQFSVMPDHVHGIMRILEQGAEAKHGAEADYSARAEQSPAPTIGDIICAYKSITTKECNKNDRTKERMIWQRNYYERIIRNDSELNALRSYIKDNPKNWKQDEHYLFLKS